MYMVSLKHKDILDRLDRMVRSMNFSSYEEFDIELLDCVDVKIRFEQGKLLDTDPMLIEKLYFKYLM